MNRFFFIFLILLTFVSCSTHKKLMSTPNDAVKSFIEALNKQDGQTVYELIAPENRKGVEDNIKLFLSTVLEVQPKNKEIKNLLDLNGEGFFKAFIKNNPFINPNKINFNIMEVNIIDEDTKAIVSVSVNSETKKINLVSHAGNWYLSLHNLFVQEDALPKASKQEIKKKKTPTSKKEGTDIKVEKQN